MGSPFNPSRDSNVGSGNQFGEQSDIADGQQGALEHGFGQTTGRLSEEDYRDAENRT